MLGLGFRVRVYRLGWGLKLRVFRGCVVSSASASLIVGWDEKS